MRREVVIAAIAAGIVGLLVGYWLTKGGYTGATNVQPPFPGTTNVR